MDRMPAFVVTALLLGLGALLGTAQNPAAGHKLFLQRCVLCHGQHARGHTTTGEALGVVDLHSSAVQAASDAKLATVVESGTSKMMGFGDMLSKQQIRDLIAYIRGLTRKPPAK